MSTSNVRTLASKVPTVSLRGLAYLASANFLARAIILVKHYIVTSFHSEMILIYGATLDTRILLFFQAIYMLPMFLLGVLLFYGIDRESFNLVLYPTLMLVFLILIRYGSEAALLVIHWEDHKFEQTPELVFALLQDVIFIALLLTYVYVCLAFTPIKPTPLELIEGGHAGFVTAAQRNNLSHVQPNQQLSPIAPPQPQPVLEPLELPPAPAQNQQPQSVDPDSQGFNYSLRRNVDHKPKETLAVEESKPVLDEIPRETQQSNPILKESESHGVKETDLDAVPTTSSSATTALAVKSNPEPEPTASTAEEATSEEPVVTVKLNKSQIAAARKRLAESQKGSTESAEKPAPPTPSTEADVDLWGTSNGNSESSSKGDGFKTTSV